jgi:hypothetical protein
VELAPEAPEILVRLQERLLHDVRGIERPAQSMIEVQPSQQPHILAVLVQRPR